MSLYRFGHRCDVFEFDSATGDLTKEGRLLRLRPQPARVLEHLLQRPGELVSRKELQHVLWPQGTFVHFDYGLNSCFKQIRSALGESSSALFIETLVKRGVRFVAPVTRVQGTSGSLARLSGDFWSSQLIPIAELLRTR